MLLTSFSKPFLFCQHNFSKTRQQGTVTKWVISPSNIFLLHFPRVGGCNPAWRSERNGRTTIQSSLNALETPDPQRMSTRSLKEQSGQVAYGLTKSLDTARIESALYSLISNRWHLPVKTIVRVAFCLPGAVIHPTRIHSTRGYWVRPRRWPPTCSVGPSRIQSLGITAFFT